MPEVLYPDGTEGNRDFLRLLSLGLRPGIKTLKDYTDEITRGVDDLRRVFRNEVGELTPEHAREAHHLIFRLIHPWAGNFREGAVVGLEIRLVEPAEPHEIQPALSDLHEKQIQEIAKEPDFEARCHMIAEFHCRFEAIQPFMDGNGLVGRLLLDHQLNVAFGEKPWPALDFKEYKNALQAGDRQDYRIMTGLVDTLVKMALSYERPAIEYVRQTAEVIQRNVLGR